MKFFSINKNQAAVIATLLILIFLGALYFFIYLPGNERRIQEQRFSALQNIDRNIHTKIENSIGLLNNLLTGFQHADEAGRKKLLKYISGYSSGNFTLTSPELTTPLKQRLLKDSLDMDSAYAIRVDNDTREISLFFSKLEVSEKNDTTVYKIGMKFSFSQFILFLLPKDAFDEYIVFSKSKPVYESFPAGISFVKEDSLLGAKNGIGTSGVRNQVISGTNYKMFMQPVGFDANNEWIIAGLLTKKHYESEKNQLPTQMVLLLVTIMLIGMVSFPWLKLYQMGSKDRLTIADGIASIFISMLLVSLIFFVFFNYNSLFRPAINKDSKAILANGIHKALKNEIDTFYHKLEQFDKLVSLPRRDIINLTKDSVSFAREEEPVKMAPQLREITRGAHINQVFWLNKRGDEIINWTADNMNAPHGNFKNREYFKKIDEGREYVIDDNPAGRYFLEQVISWTSGTFRTVISRKSRLSSPDSMVVAALSFNLESLDSVVLPTGYLFAITDKSGNVLYHSESSRNLNENLLNIFSESNKLKSCLDAKAAGTFSTKYWGKEYNVAVKPVSGLPYFIITFEDTVYNATKEMEMYSFTFFMLFFFFGFLVLQLLAIFLVSAKQSFFKKQLLDTSWIGPKVSCQKEYVLSSVFNCVVIFLLIILFNSISFLGYIFILLISVTFIPLFLNSILAKRYANEKSNILQFKKLAKYCLWSFIGIIEIFAFKILDGPNFIYVTGYGLSVFFLGMAIYSIRQPIYNIAHHLIESKRWNLLLGKWNYVSSFAFMAFTRLLITSALPVIFFYISSHNYEQNLNIRYKQYDFSRRLLNRFPGASSESLLNVNSVGNGVYYDSSLVNSVSVVSRAKVLADPGVRAYSEEELRAIQLLGRFRLYTTDKAIIGDRFNMPATADSSFFFNHLLEEAGTKGQGTITYGQLPLPQQYLRIQSENLNYHYPSVFNENGFNGSLFWLLLICMLFIFYFIMRSIIKKLFSLNLPDLGKWKELDNKILINKNWDQPLFVIGLPDAGKKKFLLDKIRSGEITLDGQTPLYFDHADENKNNVFIAELINIPSSGNEEAEKAIWIEYLKKVFDDKNRLIIVNHFEYNIQDALSNRFKLEFLERLYLDNKCKIVILSTIHPVAFLDSALDQTFKPEDKSVPGQDLERWHVLLGHYRIIVLPLQLASAPSIDAPLHGSIVQKNNGKGIPDVAILVRGTAMETFTGQDGGFSLPRYPMPFIIVLSLEGYLMKEVEIINDNDLNNIGLEVSPSYLSARLIRQETHHTYFLRRLQGPAYEAGRELSEEMRVAKFDELAFKFQVSSHYFYMYIWQSLTKEEKFLLYDLAEDNLVNSFDDYNLSMLIAKGVVTRPDGTLKLFNKSFRNFILTAIGNSEAVKIKNRIKENGNWNTLKNPVQLVIVAILAFLLTSQEEAFAKLLTYVAALGAGVPAVLKLFSFFDKNSQKPG